MKPDHRCSDSILKPVPLRLPLRLYLRHRNVSSDEALNCGETSGMAAGREIGEVLKAAMNRWKADGLDLDRGRVDYRRLAGSEAFAEFLGLVPDLRQFDPSELSSEIERRAFWINLYNVLMIHGLVAYGAKRSAEEIKGIFVRLAYIVGGYRYSLDDIEHGILRGNRMHFVVPGVRFGARDPRRQHVIGKLDPRIHFALVCGASSCPPISIYQADKLDVQLDLAARSFVNGGGVLLNKDEITLSLSRIFQWYSVDFGGHWMGIGKRYAVINYVARYLVDEDDRHFLHEHSENLRVTYQEYDWALNV